jgi:signal transduction histidine kinase
MRFRTWPVAALGLGGLLLLVIVALVTTARRAQEIYEQVDQLNTIRRQVEVGLRRVRSDVHLSGIYVRDYLLEQERERAADYRSRLAEYRASSVSTLKELRELMGGVVADDTRIASLQVKLEEYWEAFEPLFDWTPAEKLTRSARFLRREVLPRREAVLAIAQEIEELNNTNMISQREEVARRHAAFRADLASLLWQSALLGLVVAVSTVFRLRLLERRSEEQRRAAKEAERQMRQLSQQLVATQEEERKKLSRELHDHVGQMLTGLRMELSRLERLTSPADGAHRVAITESKHIVDDVVRTVRDLSLGLRPSMLDDFGLRPALEWHVRDFTRRFGLPVSLVIHGDIDRLPDPHRTCVYRIVQEALTNCVRHSSAEDIELTVTDTSSTVDVLVSDDGIGIDPARVGSGLGLRGIEERVRELHGVVSIDAGPDGGTRLRVSLPVPALSQGATLARAVGG